MKTYRLNLHSTATVEYRLIEDGAGWHAEQHVKLEDGSWLKTWATGTHPNKFGARQAIAATFGI